MTPISKPTSRVSILARVTPALSYALPALGAAISALMLINVFQAMRNAEAAGIGAVSAGIREANFPIVVTLYLGVLLGFAGIVVGLVRMFTTTTTSTPSAWYFLITGMVGLVPILLLWEAQSLLLGVIFGRSPGGVVEVARQVSLLAMMTMLLGVVSILILLVSAFVPLPRILHAKRQWAPVVMLLLMETAVIAMTALFHLRNAWLWVQFQRS
ncbi:MAG TPA: hypothetical protein VGP81_08490 [Pyrinomonadaceae bacterium]|jgi:hypothetical protein|nr:hypothetical protein [Pyrinomonadaceae bacterium]